jgi:hypothetical protein
MQGCTPSICSIRQGHRLESLRIHIHLITLSIFLGIPDRRIPIMETRELIRVLQWECLGLSHQECRRTGLRLNSAWGDEPVRHLCRKERRIWETLFFMQSITLLPVKTSNSLAIQELRRLLD